MVGDERCYSTVELDRLQPPGPVERVKAGYRDGGRVPDVMQYCGGYESESVALSGQQSGETFGLRSYRGNVPPPARQRFTQLPLRERSRFVDQTRLHPSILTMGPGNT